MLDEPLAELDLGTPFNLPAGARVLGSRALVNIGDADRAKFDSMQRLLGMCVDNTNDMSNTIKMSFDVSDIMNPITNS